MRSTLNTVFESIHIQRRAFDTQACMWFDTQAYVDPFEFKQYVVPRRAVSPLVAAGRKLQVAHSKALACGAFVATATKYI